MKTLTVALLALCLGIAFVSVDAGRRRSNSKRRSHTGKSDAESSEDLESDERLFVGDRHNECEMCSDRLRPVCGSDRKTYKNECIFKCKNKDDKSVRVKKLHSCPSISSDGDTSESGSNSKENKKHKETKKDRRGVKHGCDCSSKEKVVCGNDGVLYRNECLMKCYSQKDRVRKTDKSRCKEDDDGMGDMLSLFGK